MTDAEKNLIDTARQILDSELSLSDLFLPARGGVPLPELNPPAPAASGAAAPPTRRPARPDTPMGTDMTPRQKTQAMEELAREIAACKNCQLHASRTQPVVGEGNPSTQLVFVGEAPGAEEDRTGRPFVGRAGELLTKMILAMGLTREDIYICNMLKCRPPDNRTPNPQEIQCCWDFLVRQLQIIQPKAIVTMGNPATQGLLNTKTGITQLRGQWQELPEIGPGLGGIPVMPTFHPAFLLRQYTPENRKKVWSDLQAVMEKLGLKPPANP